jgi:lysozyme
MALDSRRTTIAALSVSAAAFVALIAHEGWTDRAVIPVKGDVPTVGPGLTKRPDGSPVQMGDTIKPVEGITRSLAHIQESETALKRCVTAPVSQVEYDILVDFAYQYGEAATCKSGMVRAINAGDYAASCEAYLRYRFVAGYDCSTPGNRRCPGVWTRSQARRDKCVEALG